MEKAANVIGTIVVYIAGAAIYLFMFAISLAIPVVMIAAGIALYNSWQDDPAPVTTIGDVRVTPDKITNESEYRQAYLKECVDDGAPSDYCVCAFDYTIDRVGIKGMNSLAFEYNETGIVPELITEAAEYCLQ